MKDELEDIECLYVVFCVIYFIKGGVGVFGFDWLVSFVYFFENVFDMFCDGKLEVIDEFVDLSLCVIDIFEDLVVEVKEIV